MSRLTLSKKFFDAHVHFRQDDMLLTAAPYTAQHCSYALVMPNTKPPITTPERLLAYKAEIMAAVGGFKDFTPLMTFKIMPGMSAEEVVALGKAGARAGKIYPKGLTTNAEDGVDDFFALSNVLGAMEKEGLVLCLHGEMPGHEVEGMDRERAFLQTLRLIVATFPGLRIVMEHITTEAAVETILQLPRHVAATITVHHLLLTHDDVGADRMNPHNYCKPVAKMKADRAALLYAATSGCPKFFFGSDSAPHDAAAKECAGSCAGCFTAPVALPLLAEIFHQHNALGRLEKFVVGSGTSFYGDMTFPMDAYCPKLTLVQKPMRVPEKIGNVVPFWAGEEISWSVEEDKT